MPLYQILSQAMRADKMEILNSNVKIRSHQRLVMPPEGGSFRQLTSTRSNMYANNESRQNANSGVKIRSHHRLVMSPKNGSFRQLTSTRRDMHTINESTQNANSGVRNNKCLAWCVEKNTYAHISIQTM